MKSFLQRWIISTVAVLVAAEIVPGIDYVQWTDLLVAALLLGILNTFLKPILVVISLPFLLFTFGLFLIVINAVLLSLVAWLLPGFGVGGFWSAFFGALIISIVTLILNSMTGTKEPEAKVKRGPAPSPPPQRPDPRDGPGGSGPVIDV